MHLRIITLFALTTAALWPADGQNPTTLYGELALGEQRSGTAYLVELRGLDSRPLAGTAGACERRRQFEFRQIQPGSYELHVTTAAWQPGCSDIIQVNAHSNRITVRMEKHNAGSKHNGTVSMRRLQYKPSKAAHKEFVRADSAIRRGEDRKAIDHLRKPWI